VLTVILVILLAFAAGVPFLTYPDRSTFDPAIDADGQARGTKASVEIPGPNENSSQSFDKLFIIVNTNPGAQISESETAPGKSAYSSAAGAAK